MSSGNANQHQPRLLALFPQLVGHGGVQEAGRQTCVALHQLSKTYGFGYEFLSLNDSRMIETLALGGAQISIRGFDRRKLSFVLSAIRSARSFDHDLPSLVLAFHPNLGPPAEWARRSSPGAKLAIVSHGIDAWKPLPGARGRALHRSDMAVAPSRYTCERLGTAQRVPANRIFRLPWSLPLTTSELLESLQSVSLPPDFPGGRVVLAVGRWAHSERYKGADLLIGSVAQLRKTFRDLHLVLVGEGDDLPRLEQLAAATGASRNIHFIRGASNEALAACYSRAEIFALPSSGEGFGFVFLEAMAFGKPVIAAAVGGATDIVRHELNGLLISPGDSTQLSAAITRLLNEEGLRSDLGKQAKETIRTEFSATEFVGRVEVLLRELGFLG